MTLNYFKEQIHDELKGARMYIEKAIEAKLHHPAWSYQFCKMADMEADHAGRLMGMLKECIQSKSYSDAPTQTVNGVTTIINPEEIYKDLMKVFGETMTYVENMKRGL